MSLLNPELPRYGPGLGVPISKSLATINKENSNRKERSRGRNEEEEEHG